MKFVCQSCSREFDIGAPKGMQLPCPACGGMMADQETAGGAAAPAPAAPPPAVPSAPAEEAPQEEFSLDAAEAFLKAQQSPASEAPAPVPAPAPPVPAPVPAPAPPPQAPPPQAPPPQAPLPQAPLPQAPPPPAPLPPADEAPPQEQWAEGDVPQDWAGESTPEQAEALPFAGGVTAALDAAVSEGYYEEGEPEEEEGASPMVLILGWVLFGVAIVCVGVMAFFLKTYHLQLKEAGNPQELRAEIGHLRTQLKDETDNARKLTERHDELMAENDGLTVQVTDLKRGLAKAKAAEQESTGKLSGLEGRLDVSERSAIDLKKQLREIEERSRRVQADGTEALSELLAGRHALRSIEFLGRPARWGEALARLNKAVRSGENLKEARWLRGSLLVKLRRPKEAIQDFAMLDELARKDNAAGHVKALVAAGDVCRTQLDDKGRAREFYGSAAKAAAASPYGKLAQARLDVLGGHAEQARRALEQEIRAAEAAGEDHTPFRLLLAEILATSPDGHDEAIRQATRTIVADPANARALDLRAGLLIEKGRLEQATADLLRAKEIDPFGNERLVTLGSVLADLERYGQAEAVLGEALKADPDSAEAKIALGKALVGLEKHDAAVRLVSNAMKDAADSGDAYLVRGQASIALGHYREGLRDLEAAIRFGRDDARARIILARTYGTARGTKFFDPEKALSHARAAVDLTNRRNADALAALGVAYAAGNDFFKAAVEMRQAFALAPQNDAYRKLLAEYQRKAQ